MNLFISLRIADENIGGSEHGSLGRDLAAEIEICTVSLYRDLLVKLVTMNQWNGDQFDSEDKLWANSFFPPVIHKWRLYATLLILAIENLINSDRKHEG